MDPPLELLELVLPPDPLPLELDPLPEPLPEPLPLPELLLVEPLPEPLLLELAPLDEDEVPPSEPPPELLLEPPPSLAASAAGGPASGNPAFSLEQPLAIKPAVMIHPTPTKKISVCLTTISLLGEPYALWTILCATGAPFSTHDSSIPAYEGVELPPRPTKARRRRSLWDAEHSRNLLDRATFDFEQNEYHPRV